MITHLVSGRMTMSRFIHALLPLVIMGCGQAAPEAAPTPALESQQERLQAGGDRAEEPSKGLAIKAPAAVNPQFRCSADQLPRDEQPSHALLLAGPSARPRALQPGPVQRLPVRPEVIEAPPHQRAADEPDQRAADEPDQL
jgi:hypothetical protein